MENLFALRLLMAAVITIATAAGVLAFAFMKFPDNAVVIFFSVFQGKFLSAEYPGKIFHPEQIFGSNASFRLLSDSRRFAFTGRISSANQPSRFFSEVLNYNASLWGRISISLEDGTFEMIRTPPISEQIDGFHQVCRSAVVFHDELKKFSGK